MPARLVGGLSLAAGLVLLAVFVPHVGSRPLYDGVVVTEPYRYLDPGPGQHGNPTSLSQEYDVVSGQSPILSASTGEGPPQASVFANQGDLLVAPGATSIEIDIQPIEPPAQPDTGAIAGNVYEIVVTDESNMPVFPTPGGGFSVVLRQPEDVSGKATMALFADNTWQEVTSSDAGSHDFYVATPPELGVFALIIGARDLPTLSPIAIPTVGAEATDAAAMTEESLIARQQPSMYADATAAPLQTSQVQLTPFPTPIPTPPGPPPNTTAQSLAYVLIVLAVVLIIATFALPRLRRRT